MAKKNRKINFLRKINKNNVLTRCKISYSVFLSSPSFGRRFYFSGFSAILSLKHEKKVSSCEFLFERKSENEGATERRDLFYHTNY